MTHKLPLLLITSDIKQKELLINLIERLDLFSIDYACDSIEAIAKLKQNNYHFIISDISIGEVDGWCLSSLIRSDIYKCDKKIPIVLLTETHCERIAEATAKSFEINAVLPKNETTRVNEILADAFSLALPFSTRLKSIIISANQALARDLQLLLNEKFDTQHFETAKDGLAYIRQHQFDFVILDSELENDTAIALLQTVQNEQADKPIIVMTPRYDNERAEQFITKGASDFIYNPYNPDRVLNICERVCRRNDFMITNSQYAVKVNQLEQSEAKFKRLFAAHTNLLENLSSVVMELDEGGKIKFLNNAWLTLTGFELADSTGKNLMTFIDVEEDRVSSFSDRLNRLLMKQTKYSIEEVKLKTSTNSSIWVEIKFHQLSNQAGVVATIDNIDDRKKAEEKLNHLALHDTLTGLYNRYYFDTQLSRLSLLASRGNEKHSLLYIDLDHFKIINDTEGHQMGDLVLKEVAQILVQRVRHSDILCRVGGDEFVVLLVETTADDAQAIGNEICTQVENAHFQFGNNRYKISASIGVSEIDGQQNAAEYLRQADVALYVAKNKGRNQTHRFHETDTESKQQLDNMQWLHRFQEAVINDDLILHFQPVWDMELNEVAYFEALVRLEIAGQLIYPDAFIPALEGSNEIHLLDHQVVGKAIKMLRDNPQLHRVAINLSAQAFSDDRLVPLIEEKLHQYQVSGERVIFELTESASLTNVGATRRMIKRLSSIGCQFSIDDFGTGFSTFAYLKELPANSVKIDGSFVKDINNNKADRSLVEAINSVAMALGKVSVAEFVETKAIFNVISSMGVRYAQGYHISHPLPIELAREFSFSA